MKIDWENEYDFSLKNYLFLTANDSGMQALRDLGAELERLNVGVDIRLLGTPDAFPDGGWCIHKDGDVWVVYHSERGKRSGPSVFTSSYDAANFYLWKQVATPESDSSSVGLLPRRRR